MLHSHSPVHRVAKGRDSWGVSPIYLPFPSIMFFDINDNHSGLSSLLLGASCSSLKHIF